MSLSALGRDPVDGPLSLGDLERAINRARAAQPAIGAEAVLTLEVSTLASLYGRLIYERRDEVDLGALSGTERLALRLWAPRGPGARAWD